MHRSVMLREVLERMDVRPGGAYVDATLGGAGHAEAILEASAPDGRLLGLDADPAALGRAALRLARFGARFTGAQTRFSRMGEAARRLGFDGVDGVLMDLGVSSFQLDEPARGFSFQQDGPLDMRMDPTEPGTAADLVNEWPEADLAELFRRWGEEPDARRIARRIVERRARAPFRTTGALAEFVAAAKGGRHGRTHPATRVFQALRKAVNREPEELAAGLDAALGLLRTGGRLAAIAFESLEDRTVKEFMKRHAGVRESLQAGGERWVGERPAVRWVTRKAQRPGEEETAENPRARSARLRVAERIEASW